MKKWIKRVLEWFGLIVYKTRVQHKHHIRTIKRPINDCKLYSNRQMRKIKKYKKQGKTDKQVGKILGRTEGAIRQMRYMSR